MGTSTKTSSNLLPKVQILTGSFFCMKDWCYGFVPVDSILGLLHFNIDFSHLIFGTTKPEISAILYLLPYLKTKTSRSNFSPTAVMTCVLKEKSIFHSHAKWGNHKNQLLKSCSHMGTLGGKWLTRSELFFERSKNTQSLKSASLSTR